MRRQLFKGRLTFALIVIIAAASFSLLPASAVGKSQVILVLWHGVEWDDLEGIGIILPTAWGIMNTRTAGGAGVEGAYLSVGSGARAMGLAGAGVIYMQDEQDQYILNTGHPPSPIVQPDINRIVNAQQVSYTIKPGALGSALANDKRRIAAFGNSDTTQEARWAGLVAMDQLGRVWEGNISRELLLEDIVYPFGLRTNYELLLAEVRQSTADVVVVDLGDPYRFTEYEANLMPNQKRFVRERMVSEAQDFVRTLTDTVSAETAVMVLSPYPTAAKAKAGQWLSPVLLIGENNGVLSSGTTRWPGIITNMDMAPTILSLLGLEQVASMVGRPAYVEENAELFDNPLGYVQNLEERVIAVSRNRSWVLRALVGAQIILYLISLAFLIIPHSLPRKVVRGVEALLIVALALPAFLLVLPGSPWFVALLAAAIGLVCLRSRNPLWGTMAVALVTAGLIMVDILTGGWLIRFSYLGYDAIGGARFYGLGNEYMGILIGSLIVGWAILTHFLTTGHKGRQRTRQFVVIGGVLFSGALVLVAAPQWGTNVGGAITAVLGFGVTIGAVSNVKLRLRSVLVLGLGVAVVLGTMILVDSMNPTDQQSHVGRTTELLREEGITAIFLIIQRKLAMNIKLMRYSIWSRAWLVTVGVMGASFIWPSRFIRWLLDEYPVIAKGIVGTVVAGVAALVFNDSGIVAAATCMFFATTTLVILALEFKHGLV